MTKRYDPTSVEARRLQSKQRQAHRIKLKKQLEKARKGQPKPEHARHKGLDNEVFLDPAIDEAIQNAGKPAQATSPPPTPKVKHRETKPDPLVRALAKREAHLEERRRATEQREREIKERAAARVEKVQQRKFLKEKLTARTRTGQPHLAKHIDILLEKIQRAATNP